jgi:glycosyltransferase involved in cell wall biosynthesis
VLIVNTNGANTEDLDSIGVRVLHVEIERQISIWRDLRALVLITEIFLEERFDLVHSISPKAGFLAMIASSIARIPRRVHTFQGEVWVTRTGFWRFFLKTLDRLMAYLSTDLLVVSPSEQRFLIDEKVIPEGKSNVLGSGSICGVNMDRFNCKPDVRFRSRADFGIGQQDLLFLFLGRLNVDKGVLDLAAAFNEIAPAYPHIHLAFVGPDEEDMQSKILAICSPSCSGRLHFSGFSENPETTIQAADIICLPSHREGFGMVIIEAAAVGVPAIASRIYGITDAVVQGETGLLFEVGNVSELARTMEKLILQPELIGELGGRAMRRVEREFSQQKVVSANLDYYAGLLSH